MKLKMMKMARSVTARSEWNTVALTVKKGVDCDGGETCICKTPQAERPDHVWIMSNAGLEKLQVTLIQLSLRDADSINMLTHNDQVGYSIMEVIENLVLDFDEAMDAREEQWVICEVTAVLFLRTELMQMFMWALPPGDEPLASSLTCFDIRVADGEMVENLCNLVGTMFLTMLAKLEHRDLLKPDSGFKNLALIMALYIKIAQQSFSVDAFLDLDTRVLAYATKHKIAVRDVPGMKRLVDELQEDADELELPSFKAPRYDPWQWKRSFGDYQDYVEDLPFYALKPNRMGGDGLDITTWSSDRRKKHSLDEKDPMPEDVIDSLKKGLVVQLA